MVTSRRAALVLALGTSLAAQRVRAQQQPATPRDTTKLAPLRVLGSIVGDAPTASTIDV